MRFDEMTLFDAFTLARWAAKGVALRWVELEGERCEQGKRKRKICEIAIQPLLRPSQLSHSPHYISHTHVYHNALRHHPGCVSTIIRGVEVRGCIFRKINGKICAQIV